MSWIKFERIMEKWAEIILKRFNGLGGITKK
jgi:hypothetical protein